MSPLEETLQRICHEFATQVAQAFAKLPFETLYEDIGGGAPAAAPEPEPEPEPEMSSEVETSILEHLNEAGPTGSTVRAWVISTQGELEPDEHARLEREADAAIEALEERGVIQKRAFSRSRGQVYALAPV